MKLFFVSLLLLILPLHAAVEGTITNGTTGKPQSGVEITVMKLERGMVPIGQVTTDAQGRFRVDAPPPSGNLPYLVRADYRGIGYFSPARGSEVAIRVFDTTSALGAAKVTRLNVIVEPRANQLLVAETYVVVNDTSPPKTFTTKEGFRFPVAEGQIGDLQVTATGPGQLPLRQQANEAGKSSYRMDYPFRPGETRVEISYRMPYASSFTFRKALKTSVAGQPEVSIIAPLEGVSVSGEGLALSNKDESKGAAFYAWQSSKPLEFNISGALPEAPAASEGGGGGEGGGEGELSTVENPSFIFLVRWKVLVVLGVALALGLAHLYRAEAVRRT